jgi:zinc protease
MTLLFSRIHALAALAVLLFQAMPATAETLDSNITQYVLENGLTIVLAPSATAQSVSVVTKYAVGSADEAAGRSGFAHLFEHLMFEGTKAVPDFSKAVSGAGGESNAFTQEDSTTYYMTGPSEALPVFLRLDAERMANLANAVAEEDLTNQRAIVLNEMRQNLLDQPGGAARLQSTTSLHPKGHPYAHDVIGSIADLGDAKLLDVVAFHRRHYVPSNAVLSVTGRFDIERAKALIGATFGRVPRSEKPAAANAVDVQTRTQRLNFTDAVATPVITLQWPGARSLTRRSVINSMLADALTIGENSLDNRLKVREGVASSVHAFWRERRLGGHFAVYASGAQGVSADRLEAALKAALKEMQTAGISKETVSTVRAGLETDYASAPASPLGFGIYLAQSALDGDARAWRRELDIAKTVTAEELTVAFRSFTVDTAQIATILPGARNTDYPLAITGSTGSSKAETAAARPDIEIPEIALADAAALVFPPVERRVLASGASLISYTLADPAKAGITLSVKGGGIDAPVGLSDLGMNVGSRGAGSLSLAEMEVRLRENGMEINGGSSSRSSQINASGPVAKFDLLCAQLADVTLRPRFDAKEWAAALDRAVTRLEASLKSPDYQAMQKLRGAIYLAGAPEARQPDTAALKALKISDAKTLFVARMRPDQAVFHVASSLPADAVAAALDKAFKGWTASSAGELQEGTLPAVRETIVEADVPGAAQATILAALRAPREGTPESMAFGLAVHALGGGSTSRLNSSLREEKGWSYGVFASATGDSDRDNSLLLISASVQADRSRESIAEIRRIIAELAVKPITDEEFQSARRAVRAQFLNAFDSAPGLAAFSGALAAMGYGLEDLRKLLADTDAVTLEEVNRQAAIIAKSPIALSIAGDRAAMK